MLLQTAGQDAPPTGQGGVVRYGKMPRLPVGNKTWGYESGGMGKNGKLNVPNEGIFPIVNHRWEVLKYL